jgi:uncharacterized protein (TIGR03437 family)
VTVFAEFSDGQPSLQLVATSGPGVYDGSFTVGNATAPFVTVRFYVIEGTVLPEVASRSISIQIAALALSQTGLIVQTSAGAGPSIAILRIQEFSFPIYSSVTITPTTKSGGSWLSAPSIEVTSAYADVSVQVDPAGLPAGDYYGQIEVSGPTLPNSPRLVTVVLNIANSLSNVRTSVPGPARPADVRSFDASCTPNLLNPAITLQTGGAPASVSWPAPVEVDVTDNCNQPMAPDGSVTLSFSNGDPPLALISQGSGSWTATWTPGHLSNSVTVTATAIYGPPQPGQTSQCALPQLCGSAQLSTAVQQAPAPFVSPGGVVSAASYSAAGGRAPGEMVAIFGQNLAPSLVPAAAVALPDQLGETNLIYGGETLPLVYVSNEVVSAVMPYDLITNRYYQVIASVGYRLSVGQDVLFSPTDPAVFSADASGLGQGDVFQVVGSSFVLVNPANPAQAGDTVTLYAAGLGAVTVATAAGSPPPTGQLVYASGSVTATIGGVPATVSFAGLAPGFAGVYQVNVVVPTGVAPGNSVPLVLTISGNQSPAVTMAIRQ